MNQTFDSVAGRAQEPSTKDRILDAAERLFGEYGFNETSLRQITAEAKVNLAAVNYHFQSKESLVRAVLERRLGALNQRRFALLEELHASGAEVSLEGIVAAFILPVMAVKQSPVQHPFRKLIGRLYAEPDGWLMKEFQREMAPAVARFHQELRRILPEAEQADMVCGMAFGIGSLAHFMAGRELMKMVSGGAVDPDDLETAGKRLVCYISAGIRALAQHGHEWKKPGLKEAQGAEKGGGK